jgi:hypothetical protein
LGAHTSSNFAQDAQERACRAAIVGFASNHRSFKYYSCRYTITAAKANTLEDARNGKWFDQSTFKFRYIVDQGNELFESEGEPPPSREEMQRRVEATLAEHPERKDGVIGVPMGAFNRHSSLSNGQRRIGHTAYMNVVNLFSSESPGSPPKPIPFGFPIAGHPSRWYGPDGLISKPDEYVPEFVGLQAFEGKNVVAARFTSMQYGIVRQFYLDPSQGYLPVYSSCSDPKYEELAPYIKSLKLPQMQGYLISSKKCSKDRYFPERVLLVWTPVKEGNHWNLRELKITELETDKRPPIEDFTLQVADGTQICSDLSTKRLVILKQRESINVRDIDNLFALWEKSENDPFMDTALSHAQTRRWWYLAAALSSFLFISLTFWRYRQRNRYPRTRAKLHETV